MDIRFVSLSVTLFTLYHQLMHLPLRLAKHAPRMNSFKTL